MCYLSLTTILRHQHCVNMCAESIAYTFGHHGGLIVYSFPDHELPDARHDQLAFGLITTQRTAALVRVVSGSSSDFIELELVRHGEHTHVGVFAGNHLSGQVPARTGCSPWAVPLVRLRHARGDISTGRDFDSVRHLMLRISEVLLPQLSARTRSGRLCIRAGSRDVIVSGSGSTLNTSSRILRRRNDRRRQAADAAEGQSGDGDGSVNPRPTAELRHRAASRRPGATRYASVPVYQRSPQCGASQTAL
jgi:hypothetical protein